MLSPHNTDFELDYPGMAHYELPAQPDMSSPPEYSEITRDDVQHLWDQKSTVHKVPPGGEAEEQSDDAAEIHLDESDKIKLG